MQIAPTDDTLAVVMTPTEAREILAVLESGTIPTDGTNAANQLATALDEWL